jgi:hypothetical protein
MSREIKSIPIYHGRRWPVGIGNAAKRLGVSRSHLQMVLVGERTSERVSEGYAKLVKELNRKGIAA